MKVLYFTLTGNSKKFVNKLDKSIIGEPIEINKDNFEEFNMKEDYILIFGSYNTPLAVYNYIERFLKSNNNLEYCKGVVGSGNRNLNYEFLTTPKKVCRNFDLDLIMGIELFGVGNEHIELNKKLKEMANQ